jgi:hypothetical protein
VLWNSFVSSTVDVVVLDAGSSVSTISPFARLLKTAKPQVPLLLITDNAADVDNEPEPACFDAVMSRLEGPEVLLERLRMLITTADSGMRTARATRSHSSELRAPDAAIAAAIGASAGTLAGNPQ